MNSQKLYEIYTQHPLIGTDTRNIKPGSLFFALKGERFNANAFAAEALEKGAAYAIIDEKEYARDERFILVDDVLNSLQQLAIEHRGRLNIPVIAIVGSNGKTTTKELITSVLSQKYSVLATPGNFNNHIGLPLTLLQITTNHNIAVIEMGANHIGENGFLCNIANPTAGLITNNGKDHLEGFGDIEGVAKSNSELYYYLLKHGGTAFVNAHDEWLMRMALRLEKKLTYAANFDGRSMQADYMAYAHIIRPSIKFRFMNTDMSSSLSGDYNFDNIMAAVAIGSFYGLDEDQIKAGIEGYEPRNNRSQILHKAQNTIYMDAYNANPSSMEMSIKNFAAMPFENKVLILGDMFELGNYAAAEHQAIVDLCSGLQLHEVYLVGEHFSQTLHTYLSFTSTEACKIFLEGHRLTNKNVFMKGSRGMKLESLLDVIA